MGNTAIWKRPALCALGLILTLCACGDDDASATCRPTDASSCATGLSCEQVGDSGYECLPPVIVSGRVVGALDGVGIAGATIVGLDANGAARTRVARSGAAGAYELPVSVARNADRTPRTEAITLRVAASAYEPFPTAPRSALPIELQRAQRHTAAATANTYRVEHAATTVALLPRPVAERGGATIEGTLAGGSPAGALIAAVIGERAASTAVADRDGAFVLFNVPAGSVRIEGYRAGLAVTPRTVELPTTGLTGVTLAGATAPVSRVGGKVNVVNPGSGSTTSVILALASTFDANTARGEAPAGLRAGNVSGDFSIEGVPPGRYAVLAAFENDFLVRDPDMSIAGTDIVFVTVPATGAAVTLEQSFKVTGALDVVSPGAQGVEEVTAGPLMLRWADDSSEDGYELRVYDALGTLVHEERSVPRVTGGGNVSYVLDTSDATKYPAGMILQFRATSYSTTPQGARTYLSSTEDLKGVFQMKR